MAYITIAEYAKRAGVSKQTAYNRAKAPQYKGYFRRVKGILQVDEEIFFNENFKLNSTLENDTAEGETENLVKANSTENSTLENELVSILKQQIEIQGKQIEGLYTMIAEKDGIIKELSANMAQITASIQQLQHERNLIEAGQVITGQAEPKEEETETTETRPKKGLFSRWRGRK